jgi:hypothetical protein
LLLFNSPPHDCSKRLINFKDFKNFKFQGSQLEI